MSSIDDAPVIKLSSRMLLQLGVLALTLLQFGVHIAELNTILPFMGCKGVEDSHFYCIPGIGDGAWPSAVFAIGGFAGSLFGGALADARGRRWSLLVSNILFTLGSVLIVFAADIVTLSIGRLLAGLGAGLALVIVPVFISEIAPNGWRGRLGAVSQLSVTIGIVAVQFVGWLWAEVKWRYVVGVGLVAAIVALGSVYAWAVESPKWLLVQKKNLEASEAANQLGIPVANYDLELDPDATHEVPVKSLSEALLSALVPIVQFATLTKYRKSFITVAGIMTLQQFSGINSIVFYGVSILQNALPQYASFVNLLISLLNTFVTISTARLIDSAGRKPLLLTSLLGMGAGTALLAFALTYDISFLAAFAALFVVASFGVGVGPIPYLLVSEHAPHEAVGAAQSVGTSFNWIATFLIGALFPKFNEWLGPSVFYIFTACCLAGSFLIYQYVPETA